jgi:hypothetical protein
LDRYQHGWLRLAKGHSTGNNVVVPFGANAVTIEDDLSVSRGYLAERYHSALPHKLHEEGFQDQELWPGILTLLFNKGHNQCLFKGIASPLDYCDQMEAASRLSNDAAPAVQYLPLENTILSLRENMMIHAPEVGGAVAFNQHQKRRKTHCL